MHGLRVTGSSHPTGLMASSQHPPKKNSQMSSCSLWPQSLNITVEAGPHLSSAAPFKHQEFITTGQILKAVSTYPCRPGKKAAEGSDQGPESRAGKTEPCSLITAFLPRPQPKCREDKCLIIWKLRLEPDAALSLSLHKHTQVHTHTP